MVKKIILLLLLPIYICSSLSVFASESLYYDDFSDCKVGERPTGYTTSVLGNSKISVEEALVLGETKNVLKLEHNNAQVSVVKKVDSLNVVTAEMRFRRVNTAQTQHPSIVLVALKGSTEVFRVYANSSANRIIINSALGVTSLFSPSNNGEMYIENDVWNTFSIYVNTVTHKAGFKIESDLLKGLTLVDNVNVRYDTKDGIAVGDNIDIDPSVDSIDGIRVFTGGDYTGVFEIDYIDIDNKDNPFKLVKKKPEPLPLPMADSPEERLVPEVTNVVIDNSVCYYPFYPMLRNGVYYAEYKKTFEALGYTAYADGDVITAYNGSSKITLDYKTGELNIDETKVNISLGKVKYDYIMIPVAEIATKLGYNVREGDNTLYISKNELFGLKMSPYTFKGTTGEDGDDNIYIFHFGQRDNKFEDIGIEINGKKYQAINFDEASGTKFGIGISDPLNKLGDKYIIKPYWGTHYGEGIMVDKNAQ